MGGVINKALDIEKFFKIFRRIDAVLKKYNLLIDFCFWHGYKKHFIMPATNRKFWKNINGFVVTDSKVKNKLLLYGERN
jgi:G:T-mismatch repair DNA endonuclease (very short patch repair protein)